VALGATAVTAVFGPTVKVMAQRGRVLRTPLAEAGFATVHPSSVLRTPSESRAAAEQAFVGDLKKIARYLASHPD
jgi:uracil-DNA glycosylase